MFKITSQERFVMAPPNQGWSLERGANHFDGEPPEAVAVKLRELIKKSFVKVELLDLNANSTPWEAEAVDPKKTEIMTHDEIAPLDPVAAMADIVQPSKSVFPKKS